MVPFDTCGHNFNAFVALDTYRIVALDAHQQMDRQYGDNLHEAALMLLDNNGGVPSNSKIAKGRSERVLTSE